MANSWWTKLAGAQSDPPEPPRAQLEESLTIAIPTLWVSGNHPGIFFTPQPAPPPLDRAKVDALKESQPYTVEERFPDRMEVIPAWRAWDVAHKKKGWRLEALGRSTIWKPRKTLAAVCDEGDAHPAPCRDCNCGVWAFKELDGLLSAIDGNYGPIRVLGQVSLWGRVIETENGWRAQYAYPSELWLLDSSLEELGRIYDVPVRMIRAPA